jgi:hypothetical protein
MPEFKERMTYEEQMTEAMREVFDAAMAVAAGGIVAVNAAIKDALKKYVGPILEEIQRRVIIILLILFGDDDRGSVLGDAPEGKGPIYDDLNKRATKGAEKQVDDLADQMTETNKSWYDEWNEDQPFEDWARERLFPDSRAGNVAITETTNAVTLGERTVVDQMRELGVGVDALWITKRDERVCPVCGPLHNQPSSQWADEFAMGPPAHPRCRCYLIYFLGEQ